MAPAGIVYIDGVFYPPDQAKISVFDHGLLYGDGVFEGIRFYNRRVFKLDRHLERMYHSARLIGLEPPVAPDEFRRIILQTTARSGLSDGYLRPLFTRGPGDLGLDPRKAKRSSVVVICSTISLYGAKHETGLTAIVSTYRRTPPVSLNPNIKSLNYLNNILAKSEANARGADEAILLDLEGNVAEASADNIFVVKGRVVYTPPTTHTLVGITRETLLELCQGHYETRVEPFGLPFLLGADEVFITGTGGEVAPVVEVDGHRIGTGRPGPVTRDLKERYLHLVRSTGTPIPANGTGEVGRAGALPSEA
jgi:branched-chain amino acid aminotransferase